MLVYEKNNKLNISFDNEIKENPDLQIGKEDGKTEIVVDGQKNPAIPVPVLPEDVGKAIVVSEDGSYELAEVSGNAPLVVTFSGTSDNEDAACDKTWAQIHSADTNVQLWYENRNGVKFMLTPIVANSYVEGELYVVDDSNRLMYFISVIIRNNGDVACVYV